MPVSAVLSLPSMPFRRPPPQFAVRCPFAAFDAVSPPSPTVCSALSLQCRFAAFPPTALAALFSPLCRSLTERSEMNVIIAAAAATARPAVRPAALRPEAVPRGRHHHPGPMAREVRQC